MLSLLTALLLTSAAGHSEESAPSLRAHAFYYSWYQNVAVDGAWAHWNHHVILRDGAGRQHNPPEDIGANFYPLRGLYSSNSLEDVSQHMADLHRAGVGVAAVTWWGAEHPTDRNLPVVFDAAARHGIQVCFHVEPFPGRNAATTRDAIAYLLGRFRDHPALYRYEGRPMIYLYDSYLTPAKEWARMLAPDGDISIRNTPDDCAVIGLWVKARDGDFMRAGHFDGFYTYFTPDGFTYGCSPAHWPALADFARQHRMLFIPSVGPGYDDTRVRPWNTVNQRGRENGAYYDRMFQAAIAVAPPIISITSYNEWHEGTQIEAAIPKQIEGYAYEDYGGLDPFWYLDRTQHWVRQWLGPPPIPTDAFADGVKHYQSAKDRKDYPRHDPAEADAIARNILLHQRNNGGWPCNWDPLRILTEDDKKQLRAGQKKRDTSFDNRATYPQTEYLAHAYARTGEPAFREGALRGIEFILKAQHPCGGWPHSYPSMDNYHPHITFMDDVTVGVLRALRRMAPGEPPFDFIPAALRARIAAAIEQGDACILNLQVVSDGAPTVWAGQYDRKTLQPTQARAYELPSLVSTESVNIVRYLMSIEPPTPEIARAVEATIAWYERAKIQGLRIERVNIAPIRYEYHTATTDVIAVEDPEAPPIWARFYEIDTNRPFMANRDGVKVYSLAEVQHERRTGYAWYTGAPSALLNEEYPAWRRRWQAPGDITPP